MPLPSFVTKIKIHPAIGFARLSSNPDDFYVFGEPHPQANYKSNGLMKRQAVRFRLFGTNADGTQCEELDLGALGIDVVWHCSLANRKTFYMTNDNGDLLSASASSDLNSGMLIGSLLNFAEGGSINLGRIHSNGIFEPPVATVVARYAGVPMEQTGMFQRDFSDNTSDGTVSVTLRDVISGILVDVEVMAAWIVVAPPDFAPETDGYFENTNGRNLFYYLTGELGFDEHALPVNATARNLDRSHLLRGAGHFAPGIEIDRPSRANFYEASDIVDAGEARAIPATAGGPNGGLSPGDMTNRLCSPWQGDFKACNCSHWVAHRPDFVMLNEGNGAQGKWLRRVAVESGPNPPGGLLDSVQDFVDHVDKLGVVYGNHIIDPSQGPEHGRNPGDDIPT